MEVETPVLQPLYGGALRGRSRLTTTRSTGRFILRIATELYLKRLIVGGLEKVYELGKDFRNEGVSHKHNPEFTMLETYEAYADYNDVAAMCEELVAYGAPARLGATTSRSTGRHRLTPPWRRDVADRGDTTSTGSTSVQQRPRDPDRLHAARAST